nr:RecName: Full=Weak neurotoxin E3 [Micrurus pyrrhocryptus]
LICFNDFSPTARTLEYCQIGITTYNPS